MANVVIEPQPDGHPFIGRTGKGDMRSTRVTGHLQWKGGARYVLVDEETYQLLLDAVNQTNAERTKDP